VTRYPLASAHGRFQPPHVEHLEYLEAALANSDHLLIGITQPENIALTDCPEDPHRAVASANPFAYGERCDMISAMLIARGHAPSRFSFSRFPIEQPDILVSSVPTHVVCLTTIRDQWNVVKIERLRSLGYVVKVLWDRRGVDGIQGTRIRARMASNDASWLGDVHPAVAEYIVSKSLLTRVRSLNDKAQSSDTNAVLTPPAQ